jgi:hypothetical protein
LHSCSDILKTFDKRHFLIIFIILLLQISESFPMKMSFLVLLFCSLITVSGYSQEKKWQIGLSSFFDNTEFGRSAVQIPQTMAGVHFLPEVGLCLDSVHYVNIGFDALHEFGSSRTVDYFYPTAYYEFNKKPYRFYMGAFPRKYALEKYPRIFFQDSIYYYRPNINGLFWERRQNENYANVWLDWTSRQSFTRHEAFFMGFSGRYNIGVFYAQHFGYMFHFAGTMDPAYDEALHDNGMFLTSVGLDLSKKTFFNVLETNAGWVVGLDRARSEHTGWIVEKGFLMETKVEYKGLGLFNSFYAGHGQMNFYSDHGNDLYWGDPVYRATMYNRSDIFVNFIHNKVVNVKFIYSLHFLENTVYHEQALKVSLNMNNF